MLFEKVEIGELNEDGSRPLRFILKEDGSSGVTYEEKGRVREGVAENAVHF
jgi:hypothetical protein